MTERLRYPLPLPGHLKQELGRELPQRANWGLVFQRFVGFSESSQTPRRSRSSRTSASVAAPPWTLEGGAKREAWDRVLSQASACFKDRELQEILEGLHLRLERAARAGGRPADTRRLEVDWRVTVGFSTPSVLETGICLHRVYGIPFVPGSAVKGITRSYCFERVAEALGVRPLAPEEIAERHKKGQRTPWEILETVLTAPADDDRRRELERRWEELQKAVRECGMGRAEPLRDLSCFWNSGEIPPTLFRQVFGTPYRTGQVIFFDAYPEALMLGDQPIVELDVLNPHYPEGEDPADYLSPVPVFFLALRQGTPFRFWLAARGEGAAAVLGAAARWVKAALTERGIGGKTAVGYGGFRG